jgi:hypothetical protein
MDDLDPRPTVPVEQEMAIRPVDLEDCPGPAHLAPQDRERADRAWDVERVPHQGSHPGDRQEACVAGTDRHCRPPSDGPCPRIGGQADDGDLEIGGRVGDEVVQERLDATTRRRGKVARVDDEHAHLPGLVNHRLSPSISVDNAAHAPTDGRSSSSRARANLAAHPWRRILG